MGLSLLKKFEGNVNSSRQRESNYKFMSPRFIPLMPDQGEASSCELSPTILALYEPAESEGNGGTRSGTGTWCGGGGKGKAEKKGGLDIASMPEV